MICAPNADAPRPNSRDCRDLGRNHETNASRGRWNGCPGRGGLGGRGLRRRQLECTTSTDDGERGPEPDQRAAVRPGEAGWQPELADRLDRRQLQHERTRRQRPQHRPVDERHDAAALPGRCEEQPDLQPELPDRAAQGHDVRRPPDGDVRDQPEGEVVERYPDHGGRLHRAVEGTQRQQRCLQGRHDDRLRRHHLGDAGIEPARGHRHVQDAIQ